jgi:hypothetical protein
LPDRSPLVLRFGTSTAPATRLILDGVCGFAIIWGTV